MAAFNGNFTVSRHALQLVRPACQTPQGVLYLSNVDNKTTIRYYIPIIQIYGCNKAREDDPAKVIKEALGKVLVHFYPFAGRLRPSTVSANKFVLHCTEEGVSFVEADADVSLQQLFYHNDQFIPPFNYVEKLVEGILGSTSIIDSPLIYIQVTRLTCGGFILGTSFNHCVSDAVGSYLFLRALAEMAKGAHVPSIPPAWERERLLPRTKPHVQFLHHDYQQDSPAAVAAAAAAEDEEMERKSFVFSRDEIALLKREAGMLHCTAFDVLSAYLWRARTRALQIPDNEEVRLIFPVNFRSRLQPPLPLGYYGNAMVSACAKTTAADLLNNGLFFATKLVQDAKATVNEEFVRSFIDFIELRRPLPVKRGIGSFMISNISRVGLKEIDYGWGKAVYGVLPTMDTTLWTKAFFISGVDKSSGTEAFVVSVCLPTTAMQEIEVDILKLKMSNCNPRTTPVIRASL